MNAREKQWDKRSNVRGRILKEWVEKNKMIIINDGKTETCVRAQGSSMVDVTIATDAAARYIREWRVDGRTDTLSDYRYIRIKIEEGTTVKLETRGKVFPRWNAKKMDKDWYTASVVGGIWMNEITIRELIGNGEIDKADRIMKRVVMDAFDNTAKRQKVGRLEKSKVYWWNTEIADLRGKCSMWRRRMIRAKRKDTPKVVEQLAGVLKESRKELKKAIGRAKKKAWEELLEGLNADPNGDDHIRE